MSRFTTNDYKWSVDGLLKCIDDNHLRSNIIFSTPTAAIVWVKGYKDSQLLGAYSEWCICQHDTSWHQYVAKNKDNVQLFFYDFTQPPKTTVALVGATFTMKNDWSIMELNCCFVRENHPIKEELFGGKSDLEAMDRILGPVFGIDFGKHSPLVKYINDFREKDKQEIKETVKTKPIESEVSEFDWDKYLNEELGLYNPHSVERHNNIDDDEEFFREYPLFDPWLYEYKIIPNDYSNWFKL